MKTNRLNMRMAWVVCVTLWMLLGLVCCNLRAAENPFDHDWSTNSPGTHLQFAWDLGSSYNQFGMPTPPPDGTEMWGAWSTNGFEKGPLWKDLESGAATNRWKIAEVFGNATNCFASFPSGSYYVGVYAYIWHQSSTNYATNYDNTGTPTIVTNVNPAVKIRSDVSNILELKIPKMRANIHLLSAETVSGAPSNVVESYEIDVSGSDERFFTLKLEAVKPVFALAPPPPPLPQ